MPDPPRLLPPVNAAVYTALRSALMRARAAHRRRMDAEQRAVVDRYFNALEDAYAQRLNRRLRTRDGCAPWCRDVRLLDAAFQLPACPPAPPTLYRGLRQLRQGTQLRVGQRVHFRGFLSCSILPLQACLYSEPAPAGMLLVLQLNESRIPGLFSPTEDEVVLPRGTAWRVQAVTPALPLTREVLRHPRHARDAFPADLLSATRRVVWLTAM